MYKGEGVAFDREGLASTLPAIVQVVFGYIAGKYIREKGRTWEMLSHLFISAALLIFLAYLWDMSFRFNKKRWTSSSVLYTTGLSIMVLGISIYFLEFKNGKGAVSTFFNVFGKNPLFIFFLSGFLPRVLALLRWADHLGEDGKATYISSLPWFYEHICKPLADNLKISSLIYALFILAFYWCIGYFLDKKKIYVKV